MKNFIIACLTNPVYGLGVITAMSIIALASALTSQYVFGMEPCILCIYQRIPYAVVIFLGVFGLMAAYGMNPKFGAMNLIFAAVAFFINSGIAFYHVGVEQHWWSSGCILGDLSNTTPDDFIAAIKSAPTVPCDQIPFELFGISMAGYNVLMCAGLGAYCLLVFTLFVRQNNQSYPCNSLSQ